MKIRLDSSEQDPLKTSKSRQMFIHMVIDGVVWSALRFPLFC
jgi:hypothetical protein